MDFLTLISGMEYKLLSARNVDILKSVYAVQDENIRVLKSANTLLEDNAALLRARIEQLVAEMAALRSAYEELASQLPPRVDYAPSPTAWEILSVFAGRHTSQINDKRDVASMDRPREAIEAAFEELCAAKILDLASIGEHGCWFRLTGHGKQFLTNHATSHNLATAAISSPTAGRAATVARGAGEADGRHASNGGQNYAVPPNVTAPFAAAELPSR